MFSLKNPNYQQKELFVLKTFIQFLESFQSTANQASRKNLTKDQELALGKNSAINHRLTYKDWTIIPSIHSTAQTVTRVDNSTFDDWKTLHAKAFNFLLNQPKKIDGDYLFFSKKMNQGYVVNVNYNRKTFRIITVLPSGHSTPKTGTIKVIVEGKAYNLVETVIFS